MYFFIQPLIDNFSTVRLLYELDEKIKIYLRVIWRGCYKYVPSSKLAYGWSSSFNGERNHCKGGRGRNRRSLGA